VGAVATDLIKTLGLLLLKLIEDMQRLGQGLFRHRVAELEPACRVTGLARQEFLVASHINLWRSCDNSERLSGSNGLLLSPMWTSCLIAIGSDSMPVVS
jgi:hypothetical protein